MSESIDETRSGIDLLSIFSFLWAAATIFHLVGPGPINEVLALDIESVANVALGIAAVCLLVNPRSVKLLGTLAALQVVEYLLSMPVGSNHYTMAFFLNVAILIAFFFVMRGGGRSDSVRQDLMAVFAPVGRYLLVTMYFYGVFHKINTGFLDPVASCAIDLVQRVAYPFGLDQALWVHHAAIYGTYIVEGAAMVMLCIPRLRYFGILIGMPLHWLIGFVDYSWYVNYSSLVFALYVLFLPPEFAVRLAGIFSRIKEIAPFSRLFGRVWQRSGFVVVVLALGPLAVLSAYAAEPSGGLRLGSYIPLYQAVWIAIWGVYASTIYATIVVLASRCTMYSGAGYWMPPARVAILVPLLFLFNGMSPYLGLKTESSIAMFSNLHTEASVTNHLLFDGPPYLFDFQKTVIDIRESSDPELQRLADRNLQLVEFAFWSYVHDHPDISVTFERNGEIIELARAGDGLTENAPPWLLRKLLPFKPVDFDRPKVCSH